jgi:hypothetical protein
MHVTCIEDRFCYVNSRFKCKMKRFHRLLYVVDIYRGLMNKKLLWMFIVFEI